MTRFTVVTAALLLCVGFCEASRDSDDVADGKGTIQAHTSSGKEAAVATVRVAEVVAKTSLQVGAKATLQHTARKARVHRQQDAKKANVTREANDPDDLRGESDNSTEGANDLDDDQENKSSSKEEPHDAPEEDGAEENAEEESGSPFCNVANDLENGAALKEIEECVKQLEMIKEGTLQQGKKSWEQNNHYVKALAHLETRMTELSRPEPFEIAFAVDQADMYEKLKNRLEAIQLDLPKLQGGMKGSVPGEKDEYVPPHEDAQVHNDENDGENGEGEEPPSGDEGEEPP